MSRRLKSSGVAGVVRRWRVGLVVAAACAAGLVVWTAGAPVVWQSLPKAAAPSSLRQAVYVVPRNAAERSDVLAVALDIWSEFEDRDGGITVVVSARAAEVLEDRGIPLSVVVDDIDAAAAAERLRIDSSARSADDGGWFNEYRDIGEIAAFMDSLAAQFADETRLKRIGTSLEGWPMRAFEIGRGDIDIVVNGGQHAREWISVMVPLCIAERLLRRDRVDGRIREILDAVTFHIVPLANPDGYAHSWSADRYWRKNRRGGHGVDLNRNYSVAWGQRGSSSSKRSQTYRGTSAFSEPESRAMRHLFEAEDVVAHIDFHSYSQLVLYPWSHSRRTPADSDKFAAIADRMSSAMVAEHGVHYKVLAGAEIGSASGTLSDWAYGERGALSFIVELRPARGSSGFVLPPEQIVPTCDESFAATTELADWVIKDRERR